MEASCAYQLSSLVKRSENASERRSHHITKDVYAEGTLASISKLVWDWEWRTHHALRVVVLRHVLVLLARRIVPDLHATHMQRCTIHKNGKIRYGCSLLAALSQQEPLLLIVITRARGAHTSSTSTTDGLSVVPSLCRQTVIRAMPSNEGDSEAAQGQVTWSASVLRQEAVTMCPSAEPGALLASMSIASEPHRCGPYTRRVECRTRSSQKCTARTRTRTGEHIGVAHKPLVVNKGPVRPALRSPHVLLPGAQ